MKLSTIRKKCHRNKSCGRITYTFVIQKETLTYSQIKFLIETLIYRTWYNNTWRRVSNKEFKFHFTAKENYKYHDYKEISKIFRKLKKKNYKFKLISKFLN